MPSQRSTTALAVIPARYGSTRLPAKPLALIGGKPMIQHVYERVAKAKRIGEVVVATDDERILSVVVRFGGVAEMTSANARSGSERVAEVARRHAASVVINVQGDEPLIHPDMVDQLAEFLHRHSAMPMASLMTPLQSAEEAANPNVVKVVTDRDGCALYFSRSPIPFQRAMPPVDLMPASPFHKHIGIYGYQRHFLLQFPRLEETALEYVEQLEQLRALAHGYKIKLLETKYDSIGVDTAEDLQRVEQLLRRG
jgi:3-deoxy-manno-octulosonate cytidylyltransferase (CMP-KDO synthetase)